MASSNTSNTAFSWGVISWIFCGVFLILGILNMFLVHAVPGVFYLTLALLYYPATGIFLKNKLGLSIPALLKLIFALLILWATLAVGDLMEMFEAWMMH